MPTGEKGRTLGDGLLQAAGFLAAASAFAEELEVVPHDHENDAFKAAQILEDVCTQSDEHEPLCFVYTMSVVCEEVAKKASQIVNDNPAVGRRLSVIFTVASATNTPHDGQVLFQHFVRGEEEAAKIGEFCLAHRKGKNLTDPNVLFLGMQTPYPKQTIKQVLCELVVEDHFRAQCMFIGLDGRLCEPRTPGDIRNWLKKAGSGAIAVSVTYDLALLASIRLLVDAGFKGEFLATTTLSVADWQEYLTKKGYLRDRKFRIWHTRVEGFDPRYGAAAYFAECLAPWTFDSVLSQPAFYVNGFAAAAQSFTDVEREVFQIILPNYISAFCFDSVRLFSVMRRKSLSRLAELDLQAHGATAAYLQQCPFAKIAFGDKGSVHVPVRIEEIVLPAEKKVAGARLASKPRALIVVDVQRDFCEGGALAAQDTTSLLPRLISVVEAARSKNDLVILTQDWHPLDHASFKTLGGSWPVHCVADSPGAALMPPIVAGPDDIVIRKGRDRNAQGYSAFESTGLSERLRAHGVRSVAVCGIATEYCVRATAEDASEGGWMTMVLHDLVRPVVHEDGERALRELADAGIKVVSSAEWQADTANGNHLQEVVRKYQVTDTQGLPKESYDVVLLVPLKEEWETVFRVLGPGMQAVSNGGYEFALPSDRPDQPYRCVATFVGEIGEVECALLTQRALERWAPATVVMLGIAAGISEDVGLCDVVVANQVDAYLDSAAADDVDEKFALFRSGKVFRPTATLITGIRHVPFRFQSVYEAWQQRISARAEDLAQRLCVGENGLLPTEKQQATLRAIRRTLKAVDGHIASGPVVGRSTAFVEWLKTRDRKYLALEMEASGMMKAVEAYGNTAATLVLRGISDLGDDRKKLLDRMGGGGIRALAVENALAFCECLMSVGLLPRARRAPDVSSAAAPT